MDRPSRTIHDQCYLQLLYYERLLITDVETKENFQTKSNQEKLNSLLKLLNISPVKDK